jgi:UDP-glucuronate 4-epimerase
VTKAARILDWQPQISLEAGIKRLVEWYVAERSWARNILTP